MKYQKLNIDFAIPEELENEIDEYINALNTMEKPPHDCFQAEIMVILNWCYRENILTNEQIKLLRDYYEHGGILRKEK